MAKGLLAPPSGDEPTALLCTGLDSLSSSSPSSMTCTPRCALSANRASGLTLCTLWSRKWPVLSSTAKLVLLVLSRKDTAVSGGSSGMLTIDTAKRGFIALVEPVATSSGEAPYGVPSAIWATCTLGPLTTEGENAGLRCCGFIIGTTLTSGAMLASIVTLCTSSLSSSGSDAGPAMAATAARGVPTERNETG